MAHKKCLIIFILKIFDILLSFIFKFNAKKHDVI